MNDQPGSDSISAQLFGDPATGHGRVLVQSALRIVITCVGLGVFYALLPITGFAAHSATSTVASVLLALVVFGAVFGWQIRRVLVAEHPILRSVEALFVVLALFLTSFSLVFLSLAASDVHAFGGSLTRIQAFYFTTTVLCTVGFGDIVPGTDSARLLVAVQMLLDLAFLAVVVRVLISAARQGISRGSQMTDLPLQKTEATHD